MSKKLSPKRYAQQMHKLAILSSILIDTIDEVDDMNMDLDFRNSLKVVKNKTEEILNTAFSVHEIRRSTYIQEMAVKIDTIIRKNYKVINNG